MAVSPRRPKGPSLNALRAFEAAARLNSFAYAAEELNVSPGAIAQHVKSLEEWLGGNLFDRHPQGITLTAYGAEHLPDLSTAFDALSNSVNAMRYGIANIQVRIATLPSIAELWLAPRLPKIRAVCPELKISITALEKPPNMQREMFDFSIFFGNQIDTPYSITLCDDFLFPVCAPSIAQELKELKNLSNFELLSDATWSDDWVNWINIVAKGSAPPKLGPVYSLYSIAVQEVVNNAGVLIGHEPLIEQHLQSGALVMAFDFAPLKGQSMLLTPASNQVQSSAMTNFVEALTRI